MSCPYDKCVGPKCEHFSFCPGVEPEMRTKAKHRKHDGIARMMARLTGEGE